MEEIAQYEFTYPISLREYPVNGGYTSTIESEDAFSSDVIPVSECYIDSEGRLWGFVRGYYCGRFAGWFCISKFPKKSDISEPTETPIPVSTPEDIYDVDGKEGITLDDAKVLLKYALGIR